MSDNIKQLLQKAISAALAENGMDSVDYKYMQLMPDELAGMIINVKGTELFKATCQEGHIHYAYHMPTDNPDEEDFYCEVILNDEEKICKIVYFQIIPSHWTDAMDNNIDLEDLH